jgi:Rho GDP-dissociation inhibitor
MRIEVDGRPPIVVPLSTPEAVAAAGAAKLVVKEGAAYTTVLEFSVYRDVVLGLKFTNSVSKMGVRVDRASVMVGSYAPRPEPYEHRLPPGEWPSGMLARGAYTAKSTFTDDDGSTHLAFTWGFTIAKEWPPA